jgi:predicted CopG family antitoxin
VLGVQSKRNETKVTTKVILPQPAYQKLQDLKRTRRKSQSEIVTELLLNA